MIFIVTKIYIVSINNVDTLYEVKVVLIRWISIINCYWNSSWFILTLWWINRYWFCIKKRTSFFFSWGLSHMTTCLTFSFLRIAISFLYYSKRFCLRNIMMNRWKLFQSTFMSLFQILIYFFQRFILKTYFFHTIFQITNLIIFRFQIIFSLTKT